MEDVFKTGNIYNFNTRYGSILGSSYKNMLLEAVCGFDYAVKYSDVVTPYRQIMDAYWPTTSSDVLINHYKNDIYFIFKTTENETKVFASLWLDYDSVVKISTKTLTIEIKDFTGIDYSRIEKALNDLGYRNFTFATTTNDMPK